MENQVTNNNDEIEIDLGEIFHLILSRLGVIILSGIILGVISIIGTMLFITPQYESTTKIMVLNKQDSNTLTSADMQTSTQLTKDYAELIKSRTVLEGVIAQLNLNITYQQLLGKLTVDTSTDSRIVTIIVSDEDPYTASEMANAIRDMAAEHIQSVMDIEAVNVVDSANIPNEKAIPGFRSFLLPLPPLKQSTIYAYLQLLILNFISDVFLISVSWICFLSLNMEYFPEQKVQDNALHLPQP